MDKYLKLASDDKERYMDAMDNYEPPSDLDIIKMKKKSRKNKKDKNEPKRNRCKDEMERRTSKIIECGKEEEQNGQDRSNSFF